ncbi:MAG: 4-hydroxy-tetrahydrodipicolinate synthase [Bacteroidales bacterium]|nr:4-hydroxy-tetrahydrodipicolinate synthase [Bacteroidales bacterium]
MRTNIFKGYGVAVATPFSPEGNIDFYALREHIRFLLDQGQVDYLCVLGTTAETPTLSTEEREMVMDTFVETVDGRVPLLLGCGSNSTHQVCEYLATANLDGFDGVLIVAPYYNKPSQEGLYRHFAMVAEASPLPIVLYNIPGRTGVNLLPETVVRIAADYENVVAIKEASGNLQQVERIIEMAPDGFEVISGDDAIAIEVMLLGGSGLISATGNAFAEEMGELVHAALEGRYDAALDIHRSLGEIFRLAFVEGNPSGVKCMMHHRGLCNNVLRLPLVPVSTAIDHDISAAMKSLGTAMQE